MINLADHKDAICARLKKITAKDWQNRLQAKGYDVTVTNKHMKNTRPQTNTESLLKLKSQGYFVKINHHRKVKVLDVNDDGLFTYKVDSKLHADSVVRKVIKEADTVRGEIPYFKYLAKGGATEMILEKDGEKINILATCYSKDHFCRRNGVKVCLEKLKKLYNIEA